MLRQGGWYIEKNLDRGGGKTLGTYEIKGSCLGKGRTNTGSGTTRQRGMAHTGRVGRKKGNRTDRTGRDYNGSRSGKKSGSIPDGHL